MALASTRFKLSIRILFCEIPKVQTVMKIINIIKFFIVQLFSIGYIYILIKKGRLTTAFSKILSNINNLFELTLICSDFNLKQYIPELKKVPLIQKGTLLHSAALIFKMRSKMSIII